MTPTWEKDVPLVADSFQTFWNTCSEHYKLDSVHFYTAPQLAYKSLLKTASEYCEHENVKIVDYP